MRTTWCLSLPPPISNTSHIPAKPPQISLVKKEEGCWRRQCVMMGVASIIGLEICNSVTLAHEAVHREEIITVSITENEVSHNSSVSNGGAKWSEKRMCPPWRGNSLETIVPENLPRPSARRRYEAIRSNSKTAPSLSLPIKLGTNNPNCFSM